MKKSVVVCILLFFQIGVVRSQNSNCSPQLDSAKVVKIAQKENGYWNNDWVFNPTVEFNSMSCDWQVQSTKTSHTKKGNCKHTNGCTVVTTLILTIDDKTQKVKSKKKDKLILPNYE